MQTLGEQWCQMPPLHQTDVTVVGVSPGRMHSSSCCGPANDTLLSRLLPIAEFGRGMCLVLAQGTCETLQMSLCDDGVLLGQKQMVNHGC